MLSSISKMAMQLVNKRIAWADKTAQVASRSVLLDCMLGWMVHQGYQPMKTAASKTRLSGATEFFQDLIEEHLFDPSLYIDPNEKDPAMAETKAEEAAHRAITDFYSRNDVQQALDFVPAIVEKQVTSKFPRRLTSLINNEYGDRIYQLMSPDEGKFRRPKVLAEVVYPSTGVTGNEALAEERKEAEEKLIEKARATGVLPEGAPGEPLKVKESKQRLTDSNYTSLSPEKNPEVYQELGTDIFTYFKKNQSLFERLLVKATFPETRVRSQDIEDSVPLARTWFKPLEERSGGQAATRGYQGKRGLDPAAESYLTKAMRDRRPIPYVYEKVQVVPAKEMVDQFEKGDIIQRRGGETGNAVLLSFHLPEIGPKIYTVMVPSDVGPAIRDAREGETFHLQVLRQDRQEGFEVQFVEQANDAIHNKLQTVKKEGLKPGGIGQLISSMVDTYLGRILSPGQLSKAIEKYGNLITINGEDVQPGESVEAVMDKVKKSRPSVTEGTDYLWEWQVGVEEEEQTKQYSQQLYPGSRAQYKEKIEDLSQGKIENIASIVSRQFPEKAVINPSDMKGTATMTNVLSTRPMVRLVIKAIMSEYLTLTRTNDVPWREFTRQLMQSPLMNNSEAMSRYFPGSDMKDFLEAVSIVAGWSGAKTPQEQEAVRQKAKEFSTGSYVMDSADRNKAQEYLRTGFGESGWKLTMKNIAESLQKTMAGLYRSGDPTIRGIMEGAPAGRAIQRAGDKHSEIIQQYENSAAEFYNAFVKKDFPNALKVLTSVGIKSGTALKPLMARKGPFTDEDLAILKNVADQVRNKGKGQAEAEVTELFKKEASDVYQTVYCNLLS